MRNMEPFYWAPERKGKGWIVFKDAPSPPPPPDYTQAAQAQGAANKDTAVAQAVLGNPNVTNPYGGQTVTYQNDPTSGELQPNINQYLSPSGQQLFDQYQSINQKLGGVADKGIGYVEGQLNSPFDQSKLPNAPVAPGQTFSQAAMARLQPQIDRDRQMSDAQLANQGIMRGSEAYNDAKLQLSNKENDLRQQVAAGSINADQTARQQAIQEQSFFRNDPLNTLNAVRSAAPVGIPQFQGYQGSSIAPPPIMQAAGLQGQADINSYNAQQAGKNSFTNGLFSLGAAALPLAFSDRRLKSNIKRIGTHPKGFGIYEYDIFDRHEIGVMADEVEKVLPDAVALHSSGFKMVNYARI